MHASNSPYGRLEFVFEGATANEQLNQILPANCVIYKVWLSVRTAASGNSSEKLNIGLSTDTDTDNIVDNQTPTVSAGTTAPTMVANYGPFSDARTITCEADGTWSTNATFEAAVICDYFRVPSLDN